LGYFWMFQIQFKENGGQAVDRCFTYDGTIEGFLSVCLRCITDRKRPHDIRPDFMIRGTRDEDRYIYVRSDFRRADRLYRYMGSCASAEVQQMIYDCFLTSLPRMELDLFDFICEAIRRGGSVTEDYSNEPIKRIQLAIRDLYRESQSVIDSLVFYKEGAEGAGGGVSVAELNPRNCVLPVLRRRILSNPSYDDLLVFDRRHYLLLFRHDSCDDLLDIRHLPIPPSRGPREVYSTFWPYIESDRLPMCSPLVAGRRESLCKSSGSHVPGKSNVPDNLNVSGRARINVIGGDNADGLTPLWRIA